MEIAGLTRVATYRREVAASQERVWENVRDWEHLPWLHSTSFSALEHVESGRWGWRVRVELAPPASRRISLELLIDAAASRYVTRTTGGVGTGTEIWTTVTPVDSRRTDIEVEFHLPDLRPEQVTPIGDAYTALYERLWDEDEAMMQLRESRLGSAVGSVSAFALDLGREAEVRDRVPIEVDFAGKPYWVVEWEGRLRVYSAICPHQLGPLGAPDAAGTTSCPWHGYRFHVDTGLACGEYRGRLFAVPDLVIDPETAMVSLRAL